MPHMSKRLDWKTIKLFRSLINWSCQRIWGTRWWHTEVWITECPSGSYRSEWIKWRWGLGNVLFNHSVIFHKTCKLKFGNEKLEKVIKWHEKEDNFGTLEKHSTLKGKWKSDWSNESFGPLGTQYSNFFEILMIKCSFTWVYLLLIL